MSAGGFDESARTTIRSRSRGRCEVCGLPLAVAEIHHRQPRGMGGSRDRQTPLVSNGLIVHPACHRKIESHRETAIANGWLVPKGTDPAGVPVKLWLGWRLLGTFYTTVDAESLSQVDRS